MRRLGIAAIGLALMICGGMVANWHTNFVNAKEMAQQEHKYILLNFSGSDWCVPCIKTKREIFDKEPFAVFADTNLILVNADFPRLSKHDVGKAQRAENEALAEQYDKQGAFPLTLLLDQNGRVVKQWQGYPGMSPQDFVNQILTSEYHH